MNPVQITITLDQSTGQVQVSGAIDNPIFAYGLLETAKETLKAYYASQSKNGLTVARSLPNGGSASSQS